MGQEELASTVNISAIQAKRALAQLKEEAADIFISRSSAVIAEKYPELRAISHTKARLLELHSSVPRRRDALMVCESSSLQGL